LVWKPRLETLVAINRWSETQKYEIKKYDSIKYDSKEYKNNNPAQFLGAVNNAVFRDAVPLNPLFHPKPVRLHLTSHDNAMNGFSKLKGCSEKKGCSEDSPMALV